jgi:hypothetical protein
MSTLRIGGSVPNRVDEPLQPKAAEGQDDAGGGTAPPSAARSPDSLVDVRLIANPEMVKAQAKAPVRTPDEAQTQAGEAAKALKAAPGKAAQVAGKVRPEAAAAAVAPPDAGPRKPEAPNLQTITLEAMKLDPARMA